MVRVILIVTTVFLALYILSQRFTASHHGNDGNDDVIAPRSGGFLIAVIAAIAVLSLRSLGTHPQKIKRFGLFSLRLSAASRMHDLLYESSA